MTDPTEGKCHPVVWCAVSVAPVAYAPLSCSGLLLQAVYLLRYGHMLTQSG